MIIFRRLDIQISIPKDEYVIYIKHYYIDPDTGEEIIYPIEGKECETSDSGDIIIQTCKNKYIIENIKNVFNYATDLLDYIKENIDSEIIYVDLLSVFDKDWTKNHCGSYYIESFEGKRCELY